MVETQLQWHMQMIVLSHVAKPLFTGVSVNLALTSLMLWSELGGGGGGVVVAVPLFCVLFSGILLIGS